jgi:hypothetical protein
VSGHCCEWNALYLVVCTAPHEQVLQTAYGFTIIDRWMHTCSALLHPLEPHWLAILLFCGLVLSTELPSLHHISSAEHHRVICETERALLLQRVMVSTEYVGRVIWDVWAPRLCAAMRAKVLIAVNDNHPGLAGVMLVYAWPSGLPSHRP